MPVWLFWSLFYVVAVGSLGVTSGLALRDLRWQDLVLWTGIGYVVVAAILVVSGQAAVRVTAGTGWACVSAAAAIGGLVALYIALGSGAASKVVPVTAAYPAVTVALAAIVLSESLTPMRLVGTGLIIAGAVVVAAT